MSMAPTVQPEPSVVAPPDLSRRKPTYELTSLPLGVSLEKLHAFLLTPDHSVDAHPLLVSARCVQPAVPISAPGAPPGLVTTVNEYVDNMPMLCGLYKRELEYQGQFWYTPDDPSVITLRVQPGAGLSIESEWRLTQMPEEEGAQQAPACTVHQRTIVRGPPILRKMVASTAKEAHERSFAGMVRKMPYPPPAASAT